jgi:hypothetical protein
LGENKYEKGGNVKEKGRRGMKKRNCEVKG